MTMTAYSSGSAPGHSRGGSRRRSNGRPRPRQEEAKAQKKTFWQRFVAFFGNGSAKKPATTARKGAQPSRPPHKPETFEAPPPLLYVANLSLEATNSAMVELFNRVPYAQN